jgi:hypothetical protein
MFAETWLPVGQTCGRQIVDMAHSAADETGDLGGLAKDFGGGGFALV